MMPRRQRPDEISIQRAKQNTFPNSQPATDKIVPRLVKLHTLENEPSSDGPEFGKISIVRYDDAPNHKSKHSQSRSLSEDYMATPFAYRHGRRYLRNPSISYPLPVDLMELHRQCLRTMLLIQVFGRPFCAPFFRDRAPEKVLEVACGSALW